MKVVNDMSLALVLDVLLLDYELCFCKPLPAIKTQNPLGMWEQLSSCAIALKRSSVLTYPTGFLGHTSNNRNLSSLTWYPPNGLKCPKSIPG